jgi:hypothetical protein
MVKRMLIERSNSGGTDANPPIIWDQYPIVVAAAFVVAAHLLGQWMAYESNSFQHPSALVLVIIVAFLALVSRQARIARGDGRKASVTIYPLGIQLVSTTTIRTIIITGQTTTQLSAPIFLPRDQVIDCVVNEIILARRVRSVVVFRVRGDCGDEAASIPMRLVQAFPDVHMTYTECLKVRDEIMQCL